MSLHDDDEHTSECFADMNNNMNNTADEETFLMNEKTEDSQQSENSESSFRELFNVYDVDRVGYILIESFIQISKQNMCDSFLGDDEKLKAFVKLLDPQGTGRIEYFAFVDGMSQLMTCNTDSYMEGNSLMSRSPGSTFMEGQSPVLHSDPSKNNDMMFEEEIFENYEPEVTSSSNKTSSNEYEFHENDKESSQDEITDSFGFDASLVQSHRKSLSVRKSISMGGLVRNSKRLSMQTLNDSALNNTQSYEEDRLDGGSERYEQLIEDLEFKIKNLETDNQRLEHEKNEHVEKNKFLIEQSSNFNMKIGEFEDHNLELERRYNIQIQHENARHQETLNKTYLQQQVETENYLNRIRSLEIECEEQHLENINNRKRVDELIRRCDQQEFTISEENFKLKEINTDYEQIGKELASLKTLHDEQKIDYEKQIDQLKSEIFQSRLLLENSQQEYCHERKNTMYDESHYVNQIAQLESENKLFKTEIDKMNENIDELNANIKILRTNIQDDRFNEFLPDIPSSISQESFLSEITSSKDDELLQKLVDERKESQRLREYIAELTSKILEHDPAILENKVIKDSKSQTKSAEAGKTEITMSKPITVAQRRDSKTDSKFNYKRLFRS